jgi:tRNA(fMet)-specific endonuclease VapC
MSLYVFDTDVLTLYDHGDLNVTRRVIAHATDELATTVISVQEIVEGWLGYVKRQTRPDQIAHGYEELADVIPFLACFTILPYRQSSITRFDHLRGLRLNVGTNDLRIAAIALEHGAVVVTRNLRDFGRIPGITAENWAA